MEALKRQRNLHFSIAVGDRDHLREVNHSNILVIVNLQAIVLMN
jgi:hypothetical protein